MYSNSSALKGVFRKCGWQACKRVGEQNEQESNKSWTGIEGKETKDWG